MSDSDDDRFAPQAEISTGTVGELGAAWRAGLGPEQYLEEKLPAGGRRHRLRHHLDRRGDRARRQDRQAQLELRPGSQLLAVDRGRRLRRLGQPRRRRRKRPVYVLSFDDKLHAVEQATGEQLWSTQVADPTTGAYETTAPTAYDGKVFVGDSGSEDGVRGFVAAYDPKTGKQSGASTPCPRPGTGWVPKGGGGGTIYFAPTIDTATGIVYVGTGNPAPAIVGAKRPGPNLYTDSILALDAHTGKLIWYHQEVAHDLWDYDAESPVVIFNAEIEGGEDGRRGRQERLLFVLDAKTGKDLFPSARSSRATTRRRRARARSNARAPSAARSTRRSPTPRRRRPPTSPGSTSA